MERRTWRERRANDTKFSRALPLHQNLPRRSISDRWGARPPSGACASINSTLRVLRDLFSFTEFTFLKFVEGLGDGNCQLKAFEELRAQSLAYEEFMSKEWLTKYDVHPREWYDHWRLFWTPKGEAFIYTLDDEKA